MYTTEPEPEPKRPWRITPPDGPWMTEPDHEDFRSPEGLPCILNRNHIGAWCGYVGVPPGHPWHGKDRNGLGHIDVHGGITYGARCRDEICHTPEPGESDKVWWVGFDCCHAWDLMPAALGINTMLKSVGSPFSEILLRLDASFPHLRKRAVYRDISFARAQTLSLAAQAAHAAERDLRKRARARRQARKGQRGWA